MSTQRAPSINRYVKAVRVYEALRELPEGPSLVQIAEHAKMTEDQARDGWWYLKQALASPRTAKGFDGVVPVVRNRGRHGCAYYLTVDPQMTWRFVYDQAINMHTRLWHMLDSYQAMERAVAMTDVQGLLTSATAGAGHSMNAARSNMALIAHVSGDLAAVPFEVIEEALARH